MTQTSAPPTRSATSQDPFTLLFPDLESELKTTRRILERVPDGQEDWRPHEKSMTLGQLATHVAQLPGFGILMLTVDEFDGSKRGPQPKPAHSAERVEMFDEVSAQLRGLLKELTWDQAMSVWKLKFRDRVVREGTRAHMVRSAFLMHLAHHRAQLGVYLRMLGVPVSGHLRSLGGRAASSSELSLAGDGHRQTGRRETPTARNASASSAVQSARSHFS